MTMAETTTTHLGFVVIPEMYCRKGKFKILDKREEWIGEIFYHPQHRQYRAEFFLLQSWSYEELAEVSEFIKELQKRLGAV